MPARDALRRVRFWIVALAVLGALPAGAVTLPPPPLASGPEEDARIELPDAEVFRKDVELSADSAPVAEVISRLREKQALPVRIADGLPQGDTRLTLRLPKVPARAALLAIAASLGPRYRWRTRGDEAVLECRSELPPAAAGANGGAAEVQAALAEAGLLARGAGTDWQQAPLAAQLRALDVVSGLDPFAERLRAALPTEGLGGGRQWAGPVAKLPPALQNEAYRIMVQGGKARGLRGALVSASELMQNPLFLGKEPANIRVRWSPADDQWRIDFVSVPGFEPSLYLVGRRGQ